MREIIRRSEEKHKIKTFSHFKKFKKHDKNLNLFAKINFVSFCSLSLPIYKYTNTNKVIEKKKKKTNFEQELNLFQII